MANQPGALVISLDFELHWGVRDHVTRHDALYCRLSNARAAVKDMLDVFVLGTFVLRGRPSDFSLPRPVTRSRPRSQSNGRIPPASSIPTSRRSGSTRSTTPSTWRFAC